jgi:hypothetical protein
MTSSWTIDLRETLRGVGRAPGFYASAVLTLAIDMAGATRRSSPPGCRPGTRRALSPLEALRAE